MNKNLDNKNEFAKRLFIQRESRNMSIRQFADFLNIRPTTYSNWETGISVPKLEVIKDIADMLDVVPEYLVGWCDSPKRIDDVVLQGLLKIYNELGDFINEKRNENDFIRKQHKI